MEGNTDFAHGATFLGQIGTVELAAIDTLDAHNQALFGVWACYQRVTLEPIVAGQQALFGGDEGESALEMAVKERDRELILDGRDAVGMSVGIRQRHREQMDQLLADLDALQF